MTLFEFYQFADMMCKEQFSPYKREGDRTHEEKYWRRVREDMKEAIKRELIGFYDKYKETNNPR